MHFQTIGEFSYANLEPDTSQQRICPWTWNKDSRFDYVAGLSFQSPEK